MSTPSTTTEVTWPFIWQKFNQQRYQELRAWFANHPGMLPNDIPSEGQRPSMSEKTILIDPRELPLEGEKPPVYDEERKVWYSTFVVFYQFSHGIFRVYLDGRIVRKRWVSYTTPIYLF